MEQQSYQSFAVHVHSDSMKLKVEIQWHSLQNKIDFKPKVVDTLSFINGNDYPDNRVSEFSWSVEEKQSTSWSQQWDIVKSFECEVKSPDPSCTLMITYDPMCNPSTTSMPLSLKKSKPVTIAPRKTVIAYLELLVSEHVDLGFTATINCANVNKGFVEHKREGCWSGTLYKLSSSDITFKQTELGIL